MMLLPIDGYVQGYNRSMRIVGISMGVTKKFCKSKVIFADIWNPLWCIVCVIVIILIITICVVAIGFAIIIVNLVAVVVVIVVLCIVVTKVIVVCI